MTTVIEHFWPYLLTAYALGCLTMWAFLRAAIGPASETEHCHDGEQYHMHDGEVVRDHAELPDCVMQHLRSNDQ